MDKLVNYSDSLEFNLSSLSINKCNMCDNKVENNNNKFCDRCNIFRKYIYMNHFKNCDCIYCKL